MIWSISRDFYDTIKIAGWKLAEKRKDSKMEFKKQKNECKCDPKNHIKGISCDVKNCAYHDGETQCYAGCISVGPREADCSANTACVTFKPREF